MADRIRTIRPTGQGGDFTTLAAWEASEQADLVSLGERRIAHIDGDWTGVADTAEVAIDGWTTDATNYVLIRASDAARHPGKWDATKYRLSVETAWGGNAITVNENYVNVSGLLCEQRDSGFSTHAVYYVGGQYVVSDSIIARAKTPYGGSGFIFRHTSSFGCFRNCVAIGSGVADGFRFRWNWQVFAYNCTAYNCIKGFDDQDGAAIGAKNCLAQNCTDGFAGTFAASSTNNCSDIAADAPGANPITASVSFVDAANGDFTPVDTSYAIQFAGANLWNDATYPVQTDIAGNSRGGASAVFDLGAVHCLTYRRTIAPSGAHYTSLASAESGEAHDLPANNKVCVLEIQGDWSGGPDTTAVIVDGWTTDATRYIEVRAVGTARHAGKWDATKYRINVGDDYFSLRVREAYTRVDGIQIEVAPPTINYTQGATVETGGGNSRFLACVFRSPNAAGYMGVRNDSLAPCLVINCVASGFRHRLDTNGRGFYGSFLSAINCTTHDCGTGVDVDQSDIKNCIAQACGNGFATWGTASASNNCSDIASDAPGTNPRTGTVSFLDAANGDFRLSPSDTVAKDYGADLSSDLTYAFNTDIEGNTRSGAWDIGASEVQVLRVKQSAMGTGGYNVTATTSPLNTLSGSSFVIAVLNEGVLPSPPTDNKGNTYSKIGSDISGTLAGYPASVSLWICSGGNGGTGHTATGGSNWPTVFFAEITGPVAYVEGSSAAYDESSPFDSAGVATLHPDELLISAVMSESPGTHNPGASWTIEREQLNASQWTGAIASRSVASMGTYAPSWTDNASAKMLVQFVALTPRVVFRTTFDGTEALLSEGGAWANTTAIDGLDDFQKVSGVVQPTSAIDTLARLAAPTFSPDHYVQYVVGVISSAGGIAGALRIGDSGEGYYPVLKSTGAEMYYRTAGGGWVPFGSTPAVTVASGDVVRWEIIGSTITLRINGVAAATWSDSTYTTGQPGLTSYGLATATADNFEAGELPPASGGTPITGTGSVTQSAQTCSGAATHSAGNAIESSGSPTQSVQTSAGTAALLFSSSGTPTQSAQTSSGTAALVFSAVGAAAQAAQTCSGSASLRFVATGAVTQAAQTCAGSAAERFASSGSPTQAAQTAAGSAALVFSGSGSRSQTAQTGSGTASLVFSGSGSPTQSSQTGSGSATHTPAAGINGSGSPTQSAQTCSGSATYTPRAITSSGSPTQSVQTSTGSAAVAFAGSGSVTQSAQTSSGSASLVFGGSGAGVQSSQTASGSGSLSFLVIGTCMQSPQVVSGLAALVFVAAGSATQSSQTADGTAIYEEPTVFTGFGAVAQSSQMCSGSAVNTPPEVIWGGYRMRNGSFGTARSLRLGGSLASKRPTGSISTY
jgi:hypothetical protein